MLLQHDDVYSLRVFKSKETEATRATSGSIAHHSAFENLTELLKVVLQGFYGWLISTTYGRYQAIYQLTIRGFPVQSAYKHFPTDNVS